MARAEENRSLQVGHCDPLELITAVFCAEFCTTPMGKSFIKKNEGLDSRLALLYQKSLQ